MQVAYLCIKNVRLCITSTDFQYATYMYSLYYILYSCIILKLILLLESNLSWGLTFPCDRL